jgi:riboflavin transporter FmnP
MGSLRGAGGAKGAGQRSPTGVMTVTAMLAAVSTVLMFFDFPLPVFPSFLQFDFSDLPAIMAAFMFGPVAGVIIEFIKNLIHLTVTSTGGIGELANFLVGSALAFPAGFVYLKNKSKSGAVYGMLCGGVLMAVAAAVMNYYVLIPFYAKFMPIDAIIAMCAKIIPAVDSLEKVILFSIVPFNLLKAAVVCAVTYLIYKRLSEIVGKFL